MQRSRSQNIRTKLYITRLITPVVRKAKSCFQHTRKSMSKYRLLVKALPCVLVLRRSSFSSCLQLLKMWCGAGTMAAVSCSLLLCVVIINPASGRLVKRADDVDLHALQTLVHQQASAIQILQAEQAATTTKQVAMKTDLEAKDTSLLEKLDNLEKKSMAVAFSTHFSHDDVMNGILLGTHSTLKFDVVTTNIGKGYDPLTGIFTAPVGGVYAFFLSMKSTNGRDLVQLVIDKDGTVLDKVYAQGKNDDYDQATGHATTHLVAGERVWVRQDRGDAVRGSYWTVFTGFLLQAD